MNSKETQKAILKLEKMEIACIRINLKNCHQLDLFRIVYDHLFKTVIENAWKSMIINPLTCGQILAIEDCYPANWNFTTHS